MAKQSDDLFNEDNKLKANFATWDEVGKSYRGVYVEKRVVDANPNFSKAKKQTIYTLIQDDGMAVYISGRGKQDPSVIPGLETAKFGEYIGIKYVADGEKKPGLNPAKIIQVFSKGEMKPEILEKYRNEKAGMISTEDAFKAEDVPFDENE